MDQFRQNFYDITVGATRSVVGGVPCFIKHLSYRDQIDYDAKYQFYVDEAKAEGIPSNDERLAEMRTNGEWTDANDKEIEDVRQMLDSMHTNKREIKMPTMAKRHAERIKEEEDKYVKLLGGKADKIGLSCERHAEREINDYYIYTNLFQDEALAKRLYKEDEFDQLSNREMARLVQDYNRALESMSIQGIKKLAMQPFFQEYLALVGDRLADFFGKPIAQLTFFQVKLLSFGRFYLNIYQNHDTSKFSKDVMDDPDLFADYAMAAAKGKEELQKQGAGSPDTVVLGVNKEDSKAMGVKTQNSFIADMARKGGNVLDILSKSGG